MEWHGERPSLPIYKKVDLRVCVKSGLLGEPRLNLPVSEAQLVVQSLNIWWSRASTIYMAPYSSSRKPQPPELNLPDRKYVESNLRDGSNRQ